MANVAVRVFLGVHKEVVMMKRSYRMVKHVLYLVLALLLLLGQTVWAADFSKLMILHTNDSHGYDQEAENHIGMPVIAQVKKDMEAKGYQVLLLDAGDAIQGNDLANFDQGKSIIQYMNGAGYDAATLGNHEFDYGQALLKTRMREAKFPFVSCNVLLEKTGESFTQPTIILDKPCGRIGIIGLTTPTTQTSTLPSYVAGLKFLGNDALYAVVQGHVDRLQAAGCDLIIALGHMGSDKDTIGSRSEDVISHVKGIDIFIDGHDHQVKNDYVGKTLRAETGCYTANLGCIVWHNGQWQEKMIPYGTYTQPDAQVEQLVQATIQAIDEAYGRTVAVARVSLDGARWPGLRTQEMNAGDFCADAIFWQAAQVKGLGYKVDAAILNGGAVRAGLPAGQVSIKQLNAMMPFGNKVVIVQLRGSKLLELLEASTQFTPKEMGGFPQVAGIEYSLDTTVPYVRAAQYSRSTYYSPAAPGARVTIKSVGGKPFKANAVYAVAMTEFILTGGDSYGGLKDKGAIISALHTGIPDNGALLNYVTKGLGGVIGEEYEAPQGRIEIK